MPADLLARPSAASARFTPLEGRRGPQASGTVSSADHVPSPASGRGDPLFR